MAKEITYGELRAMIKSLERLPERDGRRLMALQRIRDYIEVLTQVEVCLLRANGVTWSQIGSTLGVTRQAAFQRFSPHAKQESRSLVNDRISQASANTQKLATLLKENQWAEVSSLMSSDLAAALSVRQLKDVWADLIASVGNLEDVDAAPALLMGEAVVIELHMKFEAGAVTCRTAWDSAGRLSGLRFFPSPG